jgi:hypothetical protein
MIVSWLWSGEVWLIEQRQVATGLGCAQAAADQTACQHRSFATQSTQSSQPARQAPAWKICSALSSWPFLP